MYDGIHTGRVEIMGNAIGQMHQDKQAYLASEDKKPSTQEIPEQVEKLGNSLGVANNLLQALHQRLASVMPPSHPEATSGVSGGTREPSTPLGTQLAELARLAEQNNSSIRYLLERIKL